MLVKRTFGTKLEAVDAFGLSNELLRPRGFQLGNGNPPKSQSWRRGGPPGTKSRSALKAPASIELEFNNGRVNLTATAEVASGKTAVATHLLSAYAQALELLLSTGATPDSASAMCKAAERAIKLKSVRKLASIGVIVFAVLGGGIYAMTSVKSFPNPLKLISGKSSKSGDKAQAEASKAKKSPPVIVVRKAGAQTHVTDHKSTP